MKEPLKPEVFLDSVKDKPLTGKVCVLRQRIDTGIDKAIRQIEENVAKELEKATRTTDYFDSSYATELAYTLFISGFHFISKVVYEKCLIAIAKLEQKYGKKFNKETIFHNYGVAHAQCGNYCEAIGYLSLADVEGRRLSNSNQTLCGNQIEQYVTNILKPESMKIFKDYSLGGFINEQVLDPAYVDFFWVNAPVKIINWLSISMLQWEANIESPHPINRLGSWFAVLLATRTLENLVAPYAPGKKKFHDRLKASIPDFEKIHTGWEEKNKGKWEDKGEKKWLIKLETSIPKNKLTSPIAVHIANACLVAQQARNFVSHCEIDAIENCELRTWDVMTLVCFAIIGFYAYKNNINGRAK